MRRHSLRARATSLCGFARVAARPHGFPAASAGASVQYTLAHTLEFPYGVVIMHRAQRTDSRNYFGRASGTNGVTLVDGVLLAVPDVALRWSAQPTLLGGFFANLSAHARVAHTRQAYVSPRELLGSTPATNAALRVCAAPVRLERSHHRGQVSLHASLGRLSHRQRSPERHSRARSRPEFGSGAAFCASRSWRARSALRTRASYRNNASSVVSNVAVAGQRQPTARITEDRS